MAAARELASMPLALWVVPSMQLGAVSHYTLVVFTEVVYGVDARETNFQRFKAFAAAMMLAVLVG